MDIGTALGRELGLPENKIAAVADWRATTALDDVEKLVLELAEALTATPVTVDEELRRRQRRDRAGGIQQGRISGLGGVQPGVQNPRPGLEF